MTNAEKFLKEGVSAIEFRKKLAQFIFEELGFYDGTEEAIDEVIGDFLDMIEKTQLTEDERVILRNINKQFIKVGRDSENTIYFVFEEFTGNEVKYYANVFDNVFQFIKNGEEYPIEELLKGE